MVGCSNRRTLAALHTIGVGTTGNKTQQRVLIKHSNISLSHHVMDKVFKLPPSTFFMHLIIHKGYMPTLRAVNIPEHYWLELQHSAIHASHSF